MRDTINEGKIQSSTPATSDDSYIWADYFELISLLSPEESHSNEDLYQYIFRGTDFVPEEGSTIRPERTDKQKRIIREGLDNIKRRKIILGDKYPFEYDEERLEIKIKTELSNIHYTYLVLLIASNLKYVISRGGVFTSSFEKISLDVLRILFPNATIKLFGSSNIEATINAEDKYTDTKLEDRIRHLALDICHRVQPEVGTLSPQNTGDGGLDIVGFVDMKDKRGSFPLIFAQCASSKEDWEQKQYSTSRNIWNNWININYTSLQNFIMVPFPYMNNSGEWLKSTAIIQNVLIDRIRIMNFLEEGTCSRLGVFPLCKIKK